MIDEYFKLQKQVQEYFGYVEDWKVIPMVDHRDDFWILNQDENGQGSIIYFDNQLTEQIINKGVFYSASIYTQRFLPKWVYRGEEYTLVCMDTHTDGNKWLGIFSNNKETADGDGKLKNIFKEKWGI